MRQAMPGFAGFLSVQQMFALAARADAVARLVLRHAPQRGPSYELLEGPLVGLSLKKLPPRDWTVLVQGIEALVPGGWELLNRFAFLPSVCHILFRLIDSGYWMRLSREIRLHLPIANPPS